MKLTRTGKENFVNAVMADVPEIDYDEQAATLVMKKAVAKLPPEIQAIWNDATLRGFVRCDKYINSPGCLSDIRVPPFDGELCNGTMNELHRLADLKSNQRDARRELGYKLYSVIAGCNTVKQAQERLPEFIKYLPAEMNNTPGVPAICNVVADLVQAGWTPI